MPLLKDGYFWLSDDQHGSALTEQAQGVCVRSYFAGGFLMHSERQEDVRNKGQVRKGPWGEQLPVLPKHTQQFQILLIS